MFAALLNLMQCIGILVEPLKAIVGTMRPYLMDRNVDVLVLTADPASRAAVCDRLRSYAYIANASRKPLAILTSPHLST